MGIGLYPLAALANHDCAPSAVQAFGPRGDICFRALRPLAPGDAVTIGYVDLAGIGNGGDLGVPMHCLSESEWEEMFVKAGLTNIKRWRSKQNGPWQGTLLITGERKA